MKAVVAAFNQEKALVGAFSVIANLRMQFGCNFLKHYYLDNTDNVTARYRHLREEAAYPGSVCPSREGGLELVRLVLAQVMEVHSASTHIHIGCDEVRYTVSSC